MRVRSIVLILVASAVVGGLLGGLAYVNRSPRLNLCTLSGPVGDGTAQGDAAAAAAGQADSVACAADMARLNAAANRIDPGSFVLWVAGVAIIGLGVGLLIAKATPACRPTQSLRGRDG